MKQYLDLMRHVREHGTFKEDRTGTGTYAISSSPSVSTGDSCTCSVQTSGRLARVVLVELDSGGFFVRVGDSNGAAHDEAVCCTCVSE